MTSQESSDPEGLAPRFYNSRYASFQSDLYHEIRTETYGVDLGQNSWTTSTELAQFSDWLKLKPGDHLLDVGCGSGGPTIRLAQLGGCHATGIDINGQGIANANAFATAQGVAARVRFQQCDASGPLPFAAGTFGSVVCIDTLGHLPNHQAIFAEWVRLLKVGGRLVFTNNLTITGPVSNKEITHISPIGYQLFVPPGEDERLLETAGLELITKQDTTDAWAGIVSRSQAARARREAALREIEGATTFERMTEGLQALESMTREHRCSRMVYLAAKSA